MEVARACRVSTSLLFHACRRENVNELLQIESVFVHTTGGSVQFCASCKGKFAAEKKLPVTFGEARRCTQPESNSNPSGECIQNIRQKGAYRRKKKR